MLSLRLARNLILVSVLGGCLGAVGPVISERPATCNRAQAAAFAAAGNRDSAQGHYGASGRLFLAATRSTRGCRNANGMMLGARWLAQAGTAFAQSGDYVHALSLLQTAKSRLSSLADTGDAKTATDARAYADLVQNVISAINKVAESIM